MATDPQCRKGFVLDGFPLNVVHAKSLDERLAGSSGVSRCVVMRSALQPASERQDLEMLEK